MGKSSIKSPLRYPGGKSRAVSIIREFFPEDIDVLCSPFLGGASVELACAADGIRVFGSDAFDPLVNFWNCLLVQPACVCYSALKYYPLSKEEFYDLQKNFYDIGNEHERAAAFYVLTTIFFNEMCGSSLKKIVVSTAESRRKLEKELRVCFLISER